MNVTEVIMTQENVNDISLKNVEILVTNKFWQNAVVFQEPFLLKKQYFYLDVTSYFFDLKMMFTNVWYPHKL